MWDTYLCAITAEGYVAGAALARNPSTRFTITRNDGDVSFFGACSSMAVAVFDAEGTVALLAVTVRTRTLYSGRAFQRATAPWGHWLPW